MPTLGLLICVYLFVIAYLRRPIFLVLDGSYLFIYDVHNYRV